MLRTLAGSERAFDIRDKMGYYLEKVTLRRALVDFFLILIRISCT